MTALQKLESMKLGNALVVSDDDLDEISVLDDDSTNRVRSIPNPNRVGILDAYIAWIGDSRGLEAK